MDWQISFKKVASSYQKINFFSLSYYDSWNEVLNKEQRDSQIWDFVERKTVTHYFNTKFVCKPNPVFLAEELMKVIKPTDSSIMTMMGLVFAAWFFKRLAMEVLTSYVIHCGNGWYKIDARRI